MMEISQDLGTDLSNLLKSPASDSLRFSEQEQIILKLWDQEQEVRLEINMLKAQRDAKPQPDLARLTDEEIQSQIKTAERDLLTARTKYTLRNKIIQHVLITDPVLKAVHSGPNGKELERRLLPLINERDTISMLQTTLSSKLQTINKKLATLERENIESNAANTQMAQRMLVMANDAKAERIEEVQEPRLRAQLERLEEDLTKTRKEWRTLKSVTAGVIAGSGVDWARDPRLLEVVMDEEDELD